VCIFVIYNRVFFLIVCLSVTVKLLAAKTASEMTYTVLGGVLYSIQSNPEATERHQLTRPSGWTHVTVTNMTQDDMTGYNNNISTGVYAFRIPIFMNK